MKCPLFTAAEIMHEPEFKPSSNDCLQEECAWWDEDDDRCGFRSILGELRCLETDMHIMGGKMPREGQFRRKEI